VTKKKTKRAAAKPKRKVVKKTAAKKAAAKKKPAKAKAKAKPAARSRARRVAPASTRWVKFVAKHGVVLASARGPLPSVAEAVAGEPIVGSWWAHPKGKAIFAALSEIDDSADVRCFKLVDGKVTFAHRSVWPALVRLGRDGVIATEQLGSLQQEHMPTGEHRNFVTPFPDWVDDETARAADSLSTDKARAQLAWVDAS
jgi:hypothetical protein